MNWRSALENLPEVVFLPMVGGGIDKGSNRVAFRYNGELFAGRYIEEKLGFKDCFVTAEMDTVLPRKEFDKIFWLDESQASDKGKEIEWLKEENRDLKSIIDDLQHPF